MEKHALAFASIGGVVIAVAVAFGTRTLEPSAPLPVERRPVEETVEAQPFLSEAAIVRAIDTSGPALRVLLEKSDDHARSICAVVEGRTWCRPVSGEIPLDRATLVPAAHSDDLAQVWFVVRGEGLVDANGRSVLGGEVVDAYVDDRDVVHVVEHIAEGYTSRALERGAAIARIPVLPARAPQLAGGRALYMEDADGATIVHMVEPGSEPSTVATLGPRAIGVRTCERGGWRIVAIGGDTSHGRRPLSVLFFDGETPAGTTSLEITLRDYTLACSARRADIAWVGGASRDRATGTLVSRAHCTPQRCETATVDVPMRGDDPLALPLGDRVLLITTTDGRPTAYLGALATLQDHPLALPSELDDIEVLSRSAVVHAGLAYLVIRGRDRLELVRIAPDGSATRIVR